jgi:hypothetical protein
MTALMVLRDQIIAPTVAGCRVPRRGGRPRTWAWTAVDGDYETLRRGMMALFDDLGITTGAAAA